MKNIFKRIILALCVLSLLLMSGCSSNELSVASKSFNADTYTEIDSGVVASNREYSLIWDKDTANIKLLNLNNGVCWSLLPDTSVLSENATSQAIQSPINIEYTGGINTSISFSYGANVFTNGHITSEPIENGIRVTYYFEDVCFSIPVDYVLNASSLTVSVDPTLIAEGENQLYSVSLAPFMCSAKNNEDNYLFVPSGSGAIMYTDERNDTVRSFSEMVYGYDKITEQTADISNGVEIKMPIFAAKNGNNALFAVIDSGDEFAAINANAGDTACGYSSAYATFYYRGHDKIIRNNSRSTTTQSVDSADSIRTEKFSVTYYPLYDEQADYVGMAQFYRDYLENIYGKASEAVDESVLNLNLIGGVSIEKNIIGIPYEKVEALTDYTSAQNIVSELKQVTDTSLSVTMTGYGKYGINVKKLKSGFKLGGFAGSDADRKAMLEAFNECEVSSAFSYNIVNHTASEMGFFSFTDAAKTTSGIRAKLYPFSFSLRSVDESGTIYFLTGRDKLDDISISLLNMLEKGNAKSVDLLKLGSVAYSDYGSIEYYARGSMQEQVISIIEGFKNKGISVSTHDSNIYAAYCSDKVLEAPTFSAKYDCFDEDIPFYQMVLKGTTALVGPSINETADAEKTFLNTLEAGCGLSFTLINEYTTKLATNSEYAFYSTLYSDNKEQILSMTEQAKEFLSSVSGIKFKEHKILENGVRYTLFENGNYVVVNYNDNDVATEYGIVGGCNFITGKE